MREQETRDREKRINFQLIWMTERQGEENKRRTKKIMGKDG